MLRPLGPILDLPRPLFAPFWFNFEGLRVHFTSFWMPFCFQLLSLFEGVGGMGEALLDKNQATEIKKKLTYYINLNNTVGPRACP